MYAIAIDTFHHEIICSFRTFRIVQKRFRRIAKVASENNRAAATGKLHHCGAEYMACVEKFDPEISYLERCVIFLHLPEPEGGVAVTFLIDWCAVVFFRVVLHYV